MKDFESPYTMYITKNGSMLVADFIFDRTGGIYRSQDKGTTWEKADIADHYYAKFLEAGDYVFASGDACRIARSADDGKTWELLNYGSDLKGVVDDKILDGTICYAMAYHKGKLFVGDFSGCGILYSEDFGETWKQTDRESLMYTYDDGGKGGGKESKIMENFYNLVSFKGELYAFGVYFVFRYDETTNSWVKIRDDSNFMARSTIFKDKLYCARSVVNDTYDVPFIECTSDGQNWSEVKRPEGLMDNNMRAMSSDDKNIYAAMQTNGVYFTDNEGESWTKISDGLPTYSGYGLTLYYPPLDIIPTADYLYLVVYDVPGSTAKIDGIYRMPKSELPTAINTVSSNHKPTVTLDEHALYVNTRGTVSVADASGKKVDVAVDAGKVDINRLAPGVYLYDIVSDEGKITGKFVKK